MCSPLHTIKYVIAPEGALEGTEQNTAGSQVRTDSQNEFPSQIPREAKWRHSNDECTMAWSINSGRFRPPLCIVLEIFRY